MPDRLSTSEFVVHSKTRVSCDALVMLRACSRVERVKSVNVLCLLSLMPLARSSKER